jgi:copper(I)-binding protein
MMLRAALVLALLATSSWAEEARFEAGPLVISEPWSRATPGGARVGAGYLTVDNHGSEPDRLVGAEGDLFAAGEPHETVTEAGVARMRPTGVLTIPPHGRLALEPGGYHLMLNGLKQPLKEGEQFAATLLFEKAGRVPVTFSVKGLGAGASPHAHH